MKNLSKKSLVLATLAAILAAFVYLGSGKKDTEKGGRKKVFISQFVTHPALDATTKGIVDGLKRGGYVRGTNLELIVESAQANQATASQIAAKFVGQKPDIVVGVATSSAQSLFKYAKEGKTRLVFGSVTDPLSAGLAQSLDKPGANTTGVSNFIDLEPQIKLFKQIQPNLKRLGFIYNQAEANSVIIVERLKPLCLKFGIELMLQTISKTSDTAQATMKVLGSVDAIFIHSDNTALSSLQVIVEKANKARVPVYVGDTDAVDLGALAALGPNQYEIGLQTANIICRYLKGEITDIGNVPVEFPKNVDLYVNERSASILGVSIPPEVMAKAFKVIK